MPITPQDCLSDINNAVEANKIFSKVLEVPEINQLQEDARENMVELEIDDAIQAKHEKLEAKEEKLTAEAREQTEQTNQEYMELREEEKVDYAPEDLPTK